MLEFYAQKYYYAVPYASNAKLQPTPTLFKKNTVPYGTLYRYCTVVLVTVYCIYNFLSYFLVPSQPLRTGIYIFLNS